MTGEFQHRNLPMLLLQAREAAMSVFRPILKQFSLTEQQWRIIRVLNDHPTGEMEAGQIAKECCILSPSLTGVLERMERDGLVQRVRPAQDQRKVVVSLTANSKALVKRIGPLIEEQYRRIEDRIGIPRLSDLCRVLDDLKSGMASVDPVAQAPDASASERVANPGDQADNDAIALDDVARIASGAR
ncbi:MAG TPA: homoprotocatechuate degradation operon regulator HpaR [Pararobbsia sp.]|nr:homoprotocatechuate degradation operon regulator HpaR [Pararobbsia sp.]